MCAIRERADTRPRRHAWAPPRNFRYGGPSLAATSFSPLLDRRTTRRDSRNTWDTKLSTLDGTYPQNMGKTGKFSTKAFAYASAIRTPILWIIVANDVEFCRANRHYPREFCRSD